MPKARVSVVAAGFAIGLTAITLLAISVLAPTMLDWLASLSRAQLALFRVGCTVVTVLILALAVIQRRRAEGSPPAS